MYIHIYIYIYIFDEKVVSMLSEALRDFRCAKRASRFCPRPPLLFVIMFYYICYVVTESEVKKSKIMLFQ